MSCPDMKGESNMKKHMTLDDRITIQQGLKEKKNFAEIAALIGKSRSSVSREVRAHRFLTPKDDRNSCLHRKTCSQEKRHAACPRAAVCGPRRCRSGCSYCNPACSDFEQEICTIPEKPPYVCNGCSPVCHLSRWKYDAQKAHKEYLGCLSESRKGIALNEGQLREMDDIISPLIRKGQSIAVVSANHADELPVSARTIYTYIDAGLLNAKNLDLRLKVRRRVKDRKSGPTLKVDKKCHTGRTYEDFLQYTLLHPDEPVSQLDTVEGKKGGKVLMTLMLTNCGLQLIFLLERKLAASVTGAFTQLKGKLGAELSAKMIPVILTDRGSEFTDPEKIENDPDTGEGFCRVFFCDPNRSDQKGACEKNHTHIRQVIPKGKSMDNLTAASIDLLVNHINSYPRKKWNGKAPIDVFISIYGRAAADALGLERIEADSVNLSPSLLK